MFPTYFFNFLLPPPICGVVERQTNRQTKNENGNTRWVKVCFASLCFEQTVAMERWPSQPWPSRPTRTGAASRWKCPTPGDSSSQPSEWPTCCSTSPRWSEDRATDLKRSMRWEEPSLTGISREVGVTKARCLGGEGNWFKELLFLNSRALLIFSFLHLNSVCEGRIIYSAGSLWCPSSPKRRCLLQQQEMTVCSSVSMCPLSYREWMVNI